MTCRDCGREIAENSVYCNWCGAKQLRKRRRKRDEIKVPAPTQMPSGSWRIVLRAEGVSVTEPTRERCLARARAIRAGFLEQQKAAAARGLTLREAIDKHIAKRRPRPLSPSTVRGYETIKAHRFPGKIDQPLADLSDWQDELADASETLSPKTVSNAWGLVTTVMRENGVAVPRVVLPEKDPLVETPWLTPTEILRFLPAIKGTGFEVGALLALHSLRRSEIFALTWDHIDLERQRITVAGSVVPDRDGEFVRRAENKSAHSRRVVRIVIPRLAEELARRKAEDLPICDCTIQSLYNGINLVCKKAGLPECGVHGLRRSFVSLGYHLRMSELEVQEIGGWNDAKTVHKHYLRLAQEDRINAENKLDEFYRTSGKAAEMHTDLHTPEKDAEI